MNVASIFETCCGMIFIIGTVLTVAIILYFKKRNGGNKMVRIGHNMNLRQLKNDNVALIGLGFLGVILIFIIGIVLVLSIISLVFGVLTLVGVCLCAAAAFILFMKKGAVTIAPNSPFMWLLIIGLILVFFGQFVMDIGSVDLSVVPGLEAIHNIVRVNGG
jgi:hypothetical protein